MTRALLLCLCVTALSGCALRAPPEARLADDATLQETRPVLRPLDPLLAEARRPSSARAAQIDLADRARALPRAAPAAPATGDLAARARRLWARAEALRAAEL